METAIRWSSSSTISQQKFLLVDVNRRTFQHCQVESYDGRDFRYEVLSTQKKVPPFRAFDWSLRNEDLIAVGQWSGEATVLRLDDESRPISLPIKHERLCNAVNFSPDGLLATGLERVRADFCLNIWDIERVSSSMPSSPRSAFSRQSIEPLRKLASSEGITSIKFFLQPETLVAGVKGTYLRIYDLRDSTGNPAVQFHTGCVHNIAVDALDDNYFASAAPGKDSTIQIWDRRAASGTTISGLGHQSQHTPVLEFSNTFAGPQNSIQGTVWSLRYCKSRRGCLGALASSGDFKVFHIQKQYLAPASNSQYFSVSDENHMVHQEAVSINHVSHIERTSDDGNTRRNGKCRTVAFDFTHLGGPQGRPSAIVLRADQTVGLRELENPRAALSLSLLGGLAVSKSSSFPYDPENSKDKRLLSSMMDMTFSDEATKDAQSPAHVEKSMLNFSDDYHDSDDQVRLSSREAHEVLVMPKAGIGVEAVLSLSTINRHRCLEGYLFNCKRNAEIVSGDPWLEDMWAWIGRAKGNAADEGMVADSVDLSFLGLSSIWNNDIGPQGTTRILKEKAADVNIGHAIESLVTSLQLPESICTSTAFLSHRQLCLYTCGLALTREQLETTVKELVNDAQNTKAAALAMIHDNIRLATIALRSGKASLVHRELSLALAGYVKGNRDDVWDETVQEVAKELDDPYARAILAFVSYGDWHDALAETSLPLKYRLSIALLHFEDEELSDYIRTTTEDCILHGDIEGIVLTGLTERSVPLFQKYMMKFSDLQIAVLALSFVCPRYFLHPLVDLWREVYRSHLNSYRLFTKRVQFDVQATKLSVRSRDRSAKPTLAPAPRQVSLRCNTCDSALDRNPDNMPSLSVDSQSQSDTALGTIQRTSIFGDVKSGTVCPKCGRHLPRCVICMMWLGMPEPQPTITTASSGRKSTPAENLKSQNQNRDTQKAKQTPQNGTEGQIAPDLVKDFTTVCRSCWHMSHASHAEQWFKKHQTCPVPGCDCQCAIVDNVPSFI